MGNVLMGQSTTEHPVGYQSRSSLQIAYKDDNGTVKTKGHTEYVQDGQRCYKFSKLLIT